MAEWWQFSPGTGSTDKFVFDIEKSFSRREWEDIASLLLIWTNGYPGDFLSHNNFHRSCSIFPYPKKPGNSSSECHRTTKHRRFSNLARRHSNLNPNKPDRTSSTGCSDPIPWVNCFEHPQVLFNSELCLPCRRLPRNLFLACQGWIWRTCKMLFSSFHSFMDGTINNYILDILDSPFALTCKGSNPTSDAFIMPALFCITMKRKTILFWNENEKKGWSFTFSIGPAELKNPI